MNKLVIYTDGSFKANVDSDPTLGCYGAGAHGYIFNTETGIKSTSDTPSNYTITDKGYVLNSELYKDENIKSVTPHVYIDASYSFLNKGTISRAELLAIRCMLDSVLENNNELEVKDILIWADSTYAIGVVNKILNDPDVTKGLPSDTANLDIIIELQNTINKVLETMTLSIDKVLAHSVYLGNNTADSLAFYARQQSGRHNVEKNFNIYKIAKGIKYWGFELEQNVLLNFKQLFFTNSLRAQHTEIIYTVMNYKSDVEPGTRTHDALMGLVSVGNPPTIIEDAIQSYHKAILTTSVLSTVNLKNLYSRDIAYMYSLYGNNIFRYWFKDRQVLVNNSVVISQVGSPGLASKLLLDMQFMYGFISMYRQHKVEMQGLEQFEINKHTIYVDITNKVYEKNKKGKNTCILQNGATYLAMEYKLFNKTLKFPLSLGKDTLERNQFKRLETKEPRVYLVVEQSADKSYRYYNVIDTGEDIAVYSNLYSNRIITD